MPGHFAVPLVPDAPLDDELEPLLPEDEPELPLDDEPELAVPDEPDPISKAQFASRRAERRMKQMQSDNQ